jgi:regulator of protease activity HflC (stomatin/prohibitin superfamily)
VLRASLEAERAARDAGDTAAARDANERYPADPQQLFARRLREFLEATADANFSARTVSLTGGADGIEFVEPADPISSA